MGKKNKKQEMKKKKSGKRKMERKTQWTMGERGNDASSVSKQNVTRKQKRQRLID